MGNKTRAESVNGDIPEKSGRKIPLGRNLCLLWGTFLSAVD